MLKTLVSRELIMKTSELKTVAESLIETFNDAGKISMDLYKQGLKIEIKEDNSPVSNGDLEVNKLITDKQLDLFKETFLCWYFINYV